MRKIAFCRAYLRDATMRSPRDSGPCIVYNKQGGTICAAQRCIVSCPLAPLRCVCLRKIFNWHARQHEFSWTNENEAVERLPRARRVATLHAAALASRISYSQKQYVFKCRWPRFPRCLTAVWEKRGYSGHVSEKLENRLPFMSERSIDSLAIYKQWTSK